MNLLAALGVLVTLCFAADAKYARHPPKVQLYSRDPGEFGNSNFLICHVSEFHPPDISITLLKNDEELPYSLQTDLAFKNNWQFILTRSADFTPQLGERYVCKVNHGGQETNIAWEPNM